MTNRSFVLPLLALALVGLSACADRQSTTSDAAATVKKLHRGELAAVASYDEAMGRFTGMTRVDLAAIRGDHRDAADRLAQRIQALGAMPDAKAGAWGAWAEAVTSAGKALGEDAALRALKLGENHGRDEYEDALEDKDLDADSKALIRDVLLPRQQAHLKSLDQALQSNQQPSQAPQSN